MIGRGTYPRPRADVADALGTRIVEKMFDGLVSVWEVDTFEDCTGGLASFDLQAIGIMPVRSFFVRAVDGAVRGCHGHKRSTQFLIAASGNIKVELRCKGQAGAVHLLNARLGLLIRPYVWSRQLFAGEDPILNVLSDTPYDPDEYFDETP
jgi:hypothetical protein